MHWEQTTSTLLHLLTEQKRIGIITDFDGTLSPIVNDPAAATIMPEIQGHLRRLLPSLELLAVVSGRAVADVRRMVGIDRAVFIGNHGLERWERGQLTVPPEVAAYRPQLEAVLHGMMSHITDGVHIEDKTVTASVHYRLSPNPDQTAATLRPILETLTADNGLNLHSGKMVFEIRPPTQLNKGTAFRDLVTQYKLDGALFLGDDVTDVDAMRMAQTMRTARQCYALAVGVLHEDTPAEVRDYAHITANGVEDVAQLLGWLADKL